MGSGPWASRSESVVPATYGRRYHSWPPSSPCSSGTTRLGCDTVMSLSRPRASRMRSVAERVREVSNIRSTPPVPDAERAM